MRKVIGLIIVCAMIVVPGVVLADDSKEVLIMKRNVLNERVLRLTAESNLLKMQAADAVRVKANADRLIAEINKAFPILRAQLKQYNEQLIAMEAAETAPTEPVKENAD